MTQRASPMKQRPTPIDETLVAIHTHLVLCAARDVKLASGRVREAYADAELAGIPERVLRRAVQMMAPGQTRLNEEAAALVARAEAGAAIRVRGRVHSGAGDFG